MGTSYLPHAREYPKGHERPPLNQLQYCHGKTSRRGGDVAGGADGEKPEVAPSPALAQAASQRTPLQALQRAVPWHRAPDCGHPGKAAVAEEPAVLQLL